jgi:hypothetical protein
MRITSTHALLRCLACGAEVRVRRSDADHESVATIAGSVVRAKAASGTDLYDESPRLPRLLWGRRAAVP